MGDKKGRLGAPPRGQGEADCPSIFCGVVLCDLAASVVAEVIVSLLRSPPLSKILQTRRRVHGEGGSGDPGYLCPERAAGREVRRSCSLYIQESDVEPIVEK